MRKTRLTSLLVAVAIIAAGGDSWAQAGGPDIWPSRVSAPLKDNEDLFLLDPDKILVYPQFAQAYRDSGAGFANNHLAYWVRPGLNVYEYDLTVRTLTSNAPAGTGFCLHPCVDFGSPQSLETLTGIKTGPVDIALDSNGNLGLAHMYTDNATEDVIVAFWKDDGAGWAKRESNIPLKASLLPNICPGMHCPGQGIFFNRATSNAAVKMSLDLEFDGTSPSIVVSFSDESGDDLDGCDEPINAYVFRFHDPSGTNDWVPTKIDDWVGDPGDCLTNAQVVSHAIPADLSLPAQAAYIKTVGSQAEPSELWTWDETNGKSLLLAGQGTTFGFLQLVYDQAEGIAKLAYDRTNPATQEVEVWFTEQSSPGGPFKTSSGFPDLVASMPSSVSNGTTTVNSEDLGLQQLLVDPQGVGPDMIIADMPVSGNNQVHADPFLRIRPTISAVEWIEEELRPLSGTSGQLDPDGILEEAEVLTAAIHTSSGRPVIVDVTGNGSGDWLLRWSRGPHLMLHGIVDEQGCSYSADFSQAGTLYGPIDEVGTFYTFDSLPSGSGTWKLENLTTGESATGSTNLLRGRLRILHKDTPPCPQPKTDCGLLMNEAGIAVGWGNALLPLVPAVAALAGWGIYRRRKS